MSEYKFNYDEKEYILNEDNCSGLLNDEEKPVKNINLSNIIDGLSNIDCKKLKAYKNEVKNIDFKIIGTIILNFKSGNKAYASRRYIPKIKEFL